MLMREHFSGGTDNYMIRDRKKLNAGLTVLIGSKTELPYIENSI